MNLDVGKTETEPRSESPQAARRIKKSSRKKRAKEAVLEHIQDSPTEKRSRQHFVSEGKAEADGQMQANDGVEEQAMAVADEEKISLEANSIILGGFEKKAVQKVQRVLPQWLAQPKLVHKGIKQNLVPIQNVPGIHPRLLKKLQENNIHSFFPVQSEVIPTILETVCHGFLVGRGGYQPSDICVSAPTGSGKTLAFVIPVVQALLERVVCQVRALVVLPTKELAQQVCKVFSAYVNGTGLRVVMVTGQKSFAKEQEALVQKTIAGYRSQADIVVATPGRLVDHIEQTPGFSLKHLRFLVIDEADRMIDSMNQDWLTYVTSSIFRAGDANPCMLFTRTEPGPVTAASTCLPRLPLQKLLFSATLTHNPEKLQQLGLYKPCLITSVYSERQKVTAETQTGENTESNYSLPEGLTQYYVPCNLNSKPLILLYFLLAMKFPRVLCFTNSREVSHRLFVLVQAFGGVRVSEFSSRLTPGERRRTLKEFEQGKIQLLISTDATARGIDVKGVKCVVNYDAPQYIRTYIHRVGRTARAGRAGLAFTMLLKVQEQRFLQMMKDAGTPGLQKQLVKSENLKYLLPQYQEALSQLQRTVKEERSEMFE
ncbi:ATP-dependent RNA helicase DDX51 [Microcaecilia unicolor]|uniref:ATP-dependent RNA helicase n=1 Tax=Microcaecilia unicolor TaxID=1415580 RepID=A0A6P7ZE46_9AMPH|nr:ATP-dependent RNA helicase DDX51 [Microcaecilia unicolor]